jgi:hypothetical protein
MNQEERVNGKTTEKNGLGVADLWRINPERDLYPFELVNQLTS